MLFTCTVLDHRDSPCKACLFACFQVRDRENDLNFPVLKLVSTLKQRVAGEIESRCLSIDCQSDLTRGLIVELFKFRVYRHVVVQVAVAINCRRD